MFSCQKVLAKCHPRTQHENKEISLSKGTALKVVNGVDSSSVVTSHLIPACVKELSSFSVGCVVQNANHTFIHCTWI